MPTPQGPADLGPLEADIMRLVWSMGEVQVDEVHRTLAQARDLAYTTVMTVMSRLAAKGLLHRRKKGRAYLYRAAVQRETMAKSALQEWKDRFFGGETAQAVSYLVKGEALNADELAELKALLEKLEGGGRP